LDELVGDECDTRLGDLVEDTAAVVPFDAVNVGLLQAEITAVLATLSEREAGVIRLRFGLGDGRARTLDEVGRVYGVTRERIRQIEAKTMTKLRHPARAQVLHSYIT
jgi:RNA polymerase primary sigma factor